MPTSSTTPAPASTGLLGQLSGIFGSVKNTLDNGIKTDVSVTFPASVYYDIFALIVFCTVAVIGINMAAKALSGK